MAAARPPLRRRQRSVRVTVSVSLLGAASIAVLLALPTRSALWLGLSSVFTVLMAWAALRILWTEVLQSRRENAADRAAAADAYRRLFSQRAAEHAEFTTAMTERLAEARLSQRELEGLMTQAAGRADLAESRLVSESQELEQARERVQELELTLAARQTEEAAALASWESGEDGLGGVGELVAWDARRTTQQRPRKRA